MIRPPNSAKKRVQSAMPGFCAHGGRRARRVLLYRSGL
jgi:hypothetical protein